MPKRAYNLEMTTPQHIEMAQLMSEEDVLVKQLDENREKQKAINTDAFLKELGLAFGDTIEFVSDRDTVCGVVDNIEYNRTTPQYIMVRLLKSDGKPGARTKKVWKFENKSIKVIQRNENPK